MATDSANGAPRSVRIIHRFVDGITRHPWWTVLAIGLVALVAWLPQGIYIVDNAESAAVRRFGQLIDDRVVPGLHLGFPNGIDEVTVMRTGEVLRTEVNSDRGVDLTLLTAQENLIDIRLVVQYRVSELGDYLFGTSDPDELVRQAVRAALVQATAVTEVDDLLTLAKTRIQNEVRQEAQARLDNYGTGVTLVAINLQSVNPPMEAAQAFRSVSDARAEASQMVSRAEANRNRSLSLARGEAGKTMQEAQSSKEVRVQGARGAAERFLALLEQKRRDLGQTEIELYYSTVNEVLERTRVVVLAPGQLPEIDVNLFEQGRRVPIPSRDR